MLAASSGGQQGDYGFTPLANVSDYQVALSTGAATTSYPIPVPPAAAGPAPAVWLAYNSGSVDGMHTSKNNQPGSAGIGWDIQSGSITRHLKGCNVSQAPGDLCLTGDNYSIVLNGVASRLVKNTSTGLYYLQDDPRWKVEKLTNGASGHPDAQKELWWVTTPDGVRYRFGGEIEPETGYDQDSVFYVTIYDTDPASCGNFTNDLCDKAWRWNLDRIEDTNGNVVSYFYSWEDNYYKARNDSSSSYRKRYVRAGQIARIDYSKRSGTSVQPHARVLFNSELRCTDPTSTGDCSWPSQFPDTPGDLACEAYPASCSQNKPTFWSQRRLDSIQTQIYDQSTSTWQTAAIYDLTQSFPTAPTDGQGDTSEKKLWLGSIAQRPGGSFSRSAFDQREAEDYDAQYGIGTEDTTDVGRGRNVGWTDTNDYLLYKKVDFGSGANALLARVASPFSGGQIQFRLDSTGGTLVGTVNVPNTGGWQNWSTVELTSLSNTPTGVHDLYLVFTGSLNVNWFRFRPSTTPLPGLPAVVYGQKMLNNRRNYDVAGVSPMYMSRLMTVTTELGGQVVFTYGQSHACPSSPSSNIRLPYDCFPAWDPGDPNISTDDGWVLWNKWKVLQLQKSDSFSNNDIESYTYSYSTPTWHYGDDPALPDINSCSNCPTRHWNDFRGSEVVTVTDGSGAKTEYRFHRGMNGDRLNTSGGSFAASITLSDSSTRPDENWLRGRGVETRRLKSDNSAVTRTVNWFTWTLNAGSGGSGAYFVGLQKTEQSWYGTTNKTTRSEFVYDSYGNVTREIQHGDTSTTSDDRNIERSYVYSTTVGYLVDRPQWEKLWAGTGSGSSGQEQARTDYLYDNTTTVGATPTKGNLTESRRYYTASSYYPSYIGYDNYGRPTVLTDARSNQTVTAYDSFYGYVTSTTNDLSHVTSYATDPKWGAVTQATDPNGKVTTLQYDSYGRLEKVWLPTEPTNGVASLVYSYDPASRPAYVQSSTLQVKSSATYLDSRSYVDGFGRSLQSQRPSADSGYRVVSSQKYNSLGQVLYTSAPYQISGSLSSGYAAPNWSSVTNYHQYLYEEMGRLFVDYTQSGSSTLWHEYTFYDAWWHRHYDPNGNRTDTYVDGFGQPAQVTEFNTGGASYNTAYAYDKQGNLTQTTDSLGNTTWITYNLAGWKTAMTDPDMGTWSYAYDSVGNLQSQSDARNQTLYFKYDDLNRLVEKRQTNASGTLLADYTFDDTGEKGLLSRSRAYSAAGTTEVQYVTYDARNRLTQQNWVVPTTSTGGGTFRFDYTYNEADQPTSTRYPGENGGQQGEIVSYTYNSVGQMSGVVGTNTYASSATYNPAGQLTQLAQPGITRQRVYETNTMRLSVVKAGTASPWNNRQNLIYTYDNAGNVTSLVDTQNSSQKQCFQYDYLYRLTGAFTGNSGCTAYSATGTGPYNHTYAYNAIGNITSYGTGSNTYTYGSSKPHAVTAAFGNSYAYDAVGNQTTRTITGTTYSLVYDYENRLTAVKQGTTVLAAFVYDADGNRVKGTVGGVNTVYIAGLYEYSGGAAKSYYTGPGGVVAMRSGGTVYYLLTDHLNSTARIVNSAGTTQSTSYYFPFGGNRGAAFSSLTTKRFTGQYHESTLPGGEGLYFYNARWYDGKLGRFVSADSIVPSPGNPQSFNRYAYVLNNPLKYNDPSGHSFNLPCPLCNTPPIDYSDKKGASDVLVDIVATVACLFVGCHVDREKNVVTPPTYKEAADNMALGITPAPMLAGVYAPILGKSGLTRKLQQAIMESLDEDVIVAVRSRPYRANFLDGLRRAKGPLDNVLEEGSFKNGSRLLDTGERVASDLDLAGVTRNSVPFNNSESEALGDIINGNYGWDVVTHGDLYNGQKMGFPKALSVNVTQPVYVFSRGGFIEALPFEEYVTKYMPR